MQSNFLLGWEIMKNYDGPAFYRQNEKKQNNSNKSFEELQVNLSKKINYDRNYNSRGFHPTFFPPSKGKKDFANLHDKYVHLIAALNKNADNYILFQDESKIFQQEVPLIDLTKDDNEIFENIEEKKSVEVTKSIGDKDEKVQYQILIKK